MSSILAPYNNAMRLGQGFNSYTQQICVDDAVIVDPERAENVITNDGTTMRIVAETTGKPSAWNRLKEVVGDGPNTLEVSDLVDEPDTTVSPAAKAPTAETLADTSGDASAAVGEPENTVSSEPAEPAASETSAIKAATDPPAQEDAVPDDHESETGSAVKVERDDAKEAEPDAVEAKADESKSVEPASDQSATIKGEKAVENQKLLEDPKPVEEKQAAIRPKTPAKDRLSLGKTRTRSSSVGNEQARPDAAERLKFMKQEKERLAEQRAYQRELAQEAREDERSRRKEEREEQTQLRKEKREYEAARRAAAQKAISEAVAAKKDPLTLEELNQIRAQNQFADRFEGIANSTEKYSFDATAARGPSQTVVYTSRFIDKLSDVTDDMCISGALSVKMAKIGGSGRGSFVDSDKFKQSDLNFYISVKVINQTTNFKDALVYNPMRSVAIGSDDFNKVYGDSFISGFVEGGEFNAIVSMTVHNKAKLMDIKAEAKVALTTGPVDISAEANVGIARTNLEMNTETTIQVSWCGGGNIKPMEQPWNIETIMQAAARFPDLVADCPQRTHAILTKYDSLRSFVSLRPAAYSPLQYENAQIYTNVLMDAFMSYKSLYKKLGDYIDGIQNETREFEAWPTDGEGDAANQNIPNPDKNNSEALTLMGKATASGDQRALLAAKKYSAALAAATDSTRFDASLRGLSDARKYIRRQMVFIVNEVDFIEKDPKVATDEDHEEPFQSPSLFETRLPKVQVPDRLKPKPNPISGSRIYAKTQTDEELKKAQSEQDEVENDSPSLYSMDQDLLTDETSSLDEIRKKAPAIGKYLQVSKAAPKTEKGKLFNNLDFLYPEWQVESITIGIDGIGSVVSVEVDYDNGLILKKGPGANNLKLKTLNNFQPGERIVSAAIETGEPVLAADSKRNPEGRVLSVCMWTNRGRRLLGQAAQNEILPGGRVRKEGQYEYAKVQTLYLDSAFSGGTFRGFFGRVDMDRSDGGILRLGIIWGDSTSTTTTSSAQVEDGPMTYDSDPSAVDATISTFKAERDQARNESRQAIEQAAAQAKKDAEEQSRRTVEQLNQDFETRYQAGVAEATRKAKQITFGNGVNPGRQSVSYKGDTLTVNPSMTPFLTFENGNRFAYQPDGNLVVYSPNGSVLWAMNQYGDGAGQMKFHGGNDGNLVAWKNGGSTWATNTRDCRDGFLVFSSEIPYLEIFTRDGQRRCNYP